MRGLFWLSDEQWAAIKPHLPYYAAGKRREDGYCAIRPEEIRQDVLFLYDLRLPADFAPRNTDGEVEAFCDWPMERVIETVRKTDEFKFNCALVVIDFLVRHGFIPPQHLEYVELIRGLNQQPV